MRDIASVLANPKLDDVQKHRTLERLHALSKYHRVASEVEAINDKLQQERLKVRELNILEQGTILARTTAPLWRDLLIKEDQIPALRSRACRLCLFAAKDDVDLRDRATRAFDLLVVGWIVEPPLRYQNQLAAWSQILCRKMG
jgi:hypothetical protein